MYWWINLIQLQHVQVPRCMGMWWQRMTNVLHLHNSYCSYMHGLCALFKGESNLWVLQTCIGGTACTHARWIVGWELWSVLNCWFSTMGRANSSRRSIGGRSQNCRSNISDMQNIHSTNENKDYLLPTSAWKITLPNFWLNAPVIITGWKWRNANKHHYL